MLVLPLYIFFKDSSHITSVLVFYLNARAASKIVKQGEKLKDVVEELSPINAVVS